MELVMTEYHYQLIVCNIPPVKAMAGTAFPSDFLRAKTEGNPEEKLFLPKF
jgi:hypothetical protein